MLNLSEHEQFDLATNQGIYGEYWIQMLYHVPTVLGKENCFLEGTRRFQNDVSHEEALEDGRHASSESFQEPF